MNKREAKTLVFRGLVALLDNASDNVWLSEDLSDADAQRMHEAFDEVLAEFARRGAVERTSGNIRTRKAAAAAAQADPSLTSALRALRNLRP